mmetsp:Transcript_56497/g.100642  ORF Transcript_56497/g.100642 Transcript_56497/m.100642 type:complete len:104 (-) Transcript_56497:398-709(-)
MVLHPPTSQRVKVNPNKGHTHLDPYQDFIASAVWHIVIGISLLVHWQVGQQWVYLYQAGKRQARFAQHVNLDLVMLWWQLGPAIPSFCQSHARMQPTIPFSLA